MDKKTLLKTAPQFTLELLTRHYARDLDFVLQGLDENVMWIGPLKHQFVFGRDQVANILKIEQNVVFRFADSNFQLASCGEDTCVVVGWMEVCTEEETGYLLKCRQRVTFVYKVEDDRLLATHMHVSESWDVLEEDEKFPFRLATQTYDYMQQLLRNKTGGYRKLTIYDTKKRAHFILESEIIYVEACNTRCYLHYVNGKIMIRENIGEFQKRLSERFLRVHRSFIVNVDYVIGMERFVVRLCDGIRVPVPEKKYVSFRDRIIGLLPFDSMN